MLVYIKNVQS